MAHRYGSIPDAQPEPKNKNYTWLECEHAASKGIPILAFLVDESYDWPGMREQGHGEARLRDFKAWLAKGRIKATFTTPDSLALAVMGALDAWRRTVVIPPTAPEDPAALDRYLQFLRESTRWADLRDLRTEGEAHKIELAQVYVEAVYVDAQTRNVPLKDALGHRLLLIEGDAGTGKTTFLRRMASDLAANPSGGFPAFIGVRDLDTHIEASLGKPGLPTLRHAPQWIGHYLAAQLWGLTAESVERRLREPDAVLLLDGLDEAALPGFDVARIAPLDTSAAERLVGLWSRALYPVDHALAERTERHLVQAIRSNADVAKMARVPVMLAAMALVCRDGSLPEQRAELYGSVLEWLVRTRQDKCAAGETERMGRLRRLAWWLQSCAKQRLTAVDRARAGEAMGMDQAAALAFLEAEVTLSGILVNRGTAFEFSHLTLQEYLVGREMAGFEETHLHEELMRDGRLFKLEWRDAIILLAGILLAQAPGKLRGMLRVVSAKASGLTDAMRRDLGAANFDAHAGGYKRRRLWVKEGPIKNRAAEAEALGLEGHPGLFLPRDARYWLRVDGGTVSNENAKGETHRVRSFEMGRYPVTVWEYGHFVDAGGKVPNKWDEQQQHPTRPVVRVSWHDADAYCKWARVRLSTEWEWQLAAGGPEGLKHPWGDEDTTELHANIDQWVGSPTPVGLFPDGRSPCGCDDMAGNVWEWTDSWFDDKRQLRVVRGGCWINVNHNARCAYRYNFTPTSHNDYTGFRCART